MGPQRIPGWIVGLLTVIGLLVAFGTGWSLRSTLDHDPQTGDASPTGDVAGGVSAALADGDRLRRLGQLATLFDAMQPSDVEPVLGVIEDDLAGLGECEIRLFVDAWTRLDAASALERILTWKHPPKYRAGVEAAVNGWALRDPEAARVAVEDLAQRRPRLAALLRQALVTGWALSNVDRAGLTAYLREAPDESDALLSAVLGATHRTQGPDFVLAWSEEYGRDAEPDVRSKIMRKALRVVARRNPEPAASWVLRIDDGDRKADGSRVVAEAWVERDPVAAFDWLESTVDETTRDRAVAQTFGRWLFVDRTAATDWISSVERTEFHDPAIRVLARRLMRRDAEKGIRWCEQVMLASEREDCLSMVVRYWLDSEPSRARAWVDESELDPELRAALLRGRSSPAAADETGAVPRPGGA